MKKKLALFTLFGFLALVSVSLLAQDSANATDTTTPQEVVEETATEEATPVVAAEEKDHSIKLSNKNLLRVAQHLWVLCCFV